MAEGLPRSNRKQVPRTFSPVYSSVWPFCRSFTPEQIRTNQHPRKSLKVQNQFSLNKLHSASKIAFQSPKSTFNEFLHLCCQVTLSDNNHWCHRSWRTHHSPTQSWTRFLLYMGVEQGSYWTWELNKVPIVQCTWDKRILLEQVLFQNSSTTCLDGEFDKYFLLCPPKRKGKDGR